MCQNTPLHRPYEWQTQNASVNKKKRSNGNRTPSKPSQHLLVLNARTHDAIFFSIRAEHAPQRALKTKYVALFGCKRVEKNTRQIIYGHYRHETGRSTNQTNELYTGPGLVPFFNELSRLGSLLSTKQADVGQIASLKNDGLSFTQRVFGTLGRVALQEPMVATHS